LEAIDDSNEIQKMKTTIYQVITLNSALLVTLAAVGAPGDFTNSNYSQSEHLGSTAKASEVIGTSIKDDQNQTIGKVDNLALDIENGQVVAAIVSLGGTMGVGATLHAIPPTILSVDHADKIVRLNISQDKLNAAPVFASTSWDAEWPSNQVAEIYAYFGQPVSGNRRAHWTTTQDRGENASDKLPKYGHQPVYIQRASKVMGMDVKNLQNQKLGDVKNLIVDLSSGRITSVIVASGGFLDMGEKLSAVPPLALRLDSSRKIFLLDASKEALANSPHFKSNQWPDFNEPGYVNSMQCSYQVGPTYEGGAAADNTARNVRDRNDATVTPFDQGNNSGDLSITAKIRREITSRANLSADAHNVKVITANGKVTLRGPVDNEDEKRIIADIATNVAGAEHVDNQLELKENHN
jgi:hyperosmotically inducible protein